MALCDPQPANNFSDRDLYLPLGHGPGKDDPADPQTIYWRMMATRTPNLLEGGGPGPADRPFLGLASGTTPAGDRQYPVGVNVDNTLVRSFDGTTARRLFEPALAPAGDPNSHPALRYQLLTKVFNHLTTRSNVFAVWVTVGFFAVTDDSTRPDKLGAELGRAEGRHIRHRMFAIVDRSVLRHHPGPQPRFHPGANSPGTGTHRGGPSAVVVPYSSIID